MITTVYFVRHCQSQKGKMDDAIRPLSNEGYHDTGYVLELLKNQKIDVMYCSNYKRAIETITPLATYKQLEIIQDERLKERVNGIGKINKESILQRWQDLNYHEVNGESIQQVEMRNIKALHEVLMKEQGKKIVIGTHGTALASIFHYYDHSFNYDDFMRIKNWMPYIVECQFDGYNLIEKKEIGVIDKG